MKYHSENGKIVTRRMDDGNLQRRGKFSKRYTTVHPQKTGKLMRETT